MFGYLKPMKWVFDPASGLKIEIPEALQTQGQMTMHGDGRFKRCELFKAAAENCRILQRIGRLLCLNL